MRTDLNSQFSARAFGMAPHGEKPSPTPKASRRRLRQAAEGCTITEAAERSGLTVRALRYYEEIGLITPYRTCGNARRYHGDVLQKVFSLAKLRAAGVSLPDVAAAWGDAAPERRSALLAAVIRRRLQALEADMSMLQQVLEDFEAVPSTVAA